MEQARAVLAEWAAPQPDLTISYREFSWGPAMVTGVLDGVGFSSQVYGGWGIVYFEDDDASNPVGLAQWDVADDLATRASCVVEIVRDQLRRRHCARDHAAVARRFCCECGERIDLL